MTKSRIAVVPHTHWDREWYEPFQAFRLRLVDTLDQVLDLLEDDPGYSRFTLDGQMAAVDDYLDLRPNAKDKIRKLVASGGLQIGPWYVLMDEFLVSGETIIRNLQMGMKRAAEFGGAMKIGYLPDMFGHISQMPQILRLAEIEHSVVWRGVPRQIDKDAFIWSSPDGSWVRTQYLRTGYGNGVRIPLEPSEAKSFVESELDRMATYQTDDLLLMNGSDHEPPQAELGAIVEALNKDSKLELYVTSVAEAIQGRSTEGLPSFEGELRSGARANLLMGVASNHVDVKQAAAIAERSLETRAEPAAALFQQAAWPRQALELAWHLMILNAAHDSVCACSNDEVVHAVLERYYEARQIGDSLALRSLGALARSQHEPGTCVVNLANSARDGVVQLTTTGDRAPEGTQLISGSLPLPEEIVLERAGLQAVLPLIEGEKIGNEAYVTGVEILSAAEIQNPAQAEIATRGITSGPENHVSPDSAVRGELAVGLEIRVHVGSKREPNFSAELAKQQVVNAVESLDSGMQVRVRAIQEKHVTFLAKVASVPGYGWRTIDTFSDKPLVFPIPRNPVIARESDHSIGNGLLEISFDQDAGTFSLNGIPGFGKMLEGGDLGDTYNFSPPREDQIVSTPLETRYTIEERGPLRGRARIISSYEWPANADEEQGVRQGKQLVEVTTDLEIRADSPVLLVSVGFDNTCEDHRVRYIVPLQQRATHSEAECAFAIVRRGLTTEGGPHEYPLPTFPARRFVRAGGVTVSHEGLLEYELIDQSQATYGSISPIEQADAIAITLLRSTGMLSRVGMRTRPLPAGPLLKTLGSQVKGPRVFRMGICLSDVSPYDVVRETFLPLETLPAPGGGSLEIEGTALRISGCEVSSLRREGALLELRVFNPWGTDCAVEIPGRKGCHVNLLGVPGERFEERLNLGPYQIATLRIDDSETLPVN